MRGNNQFHVMCSRSDMKRHKTCEYTQNGGSERMHKIMDKVLCKLVEKEQKNKQKTERKGFFENQDVISVAYVMLVA
ncbi:unnamed protein product [Cochlearia groenlandica]